MGDDDDVRAISRRLYRDYRALRGELPRESFTQVIDEILALVEDDAASSEQDEPGRKADASGSVAAFRRKQLAIEASVVVLNHDMLSIDQLAERSSQQRDTVDSDLVALAKRGKLIALRPQNGGGPLYPAFQFAADGHLFELVAEINGLIGVRYGAWAPASWWYRPNRILPRSGRPLEYLATALRGEDARKALLGAAKIDADPLQEGSW